MPDWLLLLLFIVVPAACAVGLHALFRSIVPADRLIPHHDVAGFLVAVVGVLYAVVLGFLVVTVWASFDFVQRTADQEAGYVGDAFGYAALLPGRQRDTTQRLIAAYAIEVRDNEWGTMAKGSQDLKARKLLIAAFRSLSTYPLPKNPTFSEALRDRSLRDGVLQSLRDVADSRRLRLIQAENHLPRSMYLALIAGGLMVLAFAFLFGVSNHVVQYTMTAIVAGCIGLLFGLVVEFNAPYSGALRVSPAAWTYIIENNHMEDVVRGAPAPLDTAGRSSP